MLELEGTVGYFEPLTPQQVCKDETEAVNLLLRPDLAGPFASTALENSYAWQGYIYDRSPDVLKAFDKAVNKDLWLKYLGMYIYEPHRMGEAVHTVSLITSAYSPHKLVEHTISPADYAPTYANEINNTKNTNKSLFVGAFSAKSVSDIWGINRHLLSGNNMSVIDINGQLSVEAAKHYNLRFIKTDGVKSSFGSNSMDIIMTNNLVNSLDSGNWDSDFETQNRLRESLLKELSRLIVNKGKLIMVEQALINDYDSDLKTQAKVDNDRFLSQLRESGFTHVQINKAELFKSRKDADFFVKSGEIDRSRVISRNGPIYPQVITAIKS